MPITALPTPPTRSDPTNFASRADSFLAALPTFQSEANALAVAMNLNSTTDTSASSVAIGLGAKTFSVTAGKSFQPGMYLVVADTAAPSTNSMIGQVTSYATTSLVMNITSVNGSGTKTAWSISQSVPAMSLNATDLAVTGNLSATGNTTLGDGAADTVTTSGNVIIAKATGTATLDPVELRVSSTNSAADWDIVNPWAKVGIYSNDAGGAGYTFSIEAVRETLSGTDSDVYFRRRTGANVMRFDANGSTYTYGNTTLGDASTDTVTVNGYMGVGGATANNISVYARNTELGTANQVGFQSGITANSAATGSVYGFLSVPSTAAASFTVGSAYHFRANNISPGAGSAVTNQYGVYIADLTVGTNNYGITSLVSSGANKWNIYASGTAANYFAGNVGIGKTPSTFKLEIEATTGGSGFSVTRGADSLLEQYQSTTGIISLAASGSAAALSLRTGTAVGTTTERLRIDSAGNVGIGTATADGSLVLAAGTAAVASAGGYLGLTTGANGSKTRGAGIEAFSTTASNDHGLRFYTNPGAGAPVERLRIDSAGNVGVGVTPSAWATTVPVIELGASSAYLAAQSGTSNVRLGVNNYYNGGYIYKTTNSASMYLQASGAHSWHTAPSGTAGNAITFTQSLAVGLGTTLALEGATSAAGTGIAFPATQLASSNANTLDDYEEGTFTPVVRDAAAGNAATAAVSIGRYTKVGSLVSFAITVRDINTTGLTAGNQIFISGMPFTSISTANHFPPMAAYTAAVTSTTGAIAALISPSATALQLINCITTGNSSLLVSAISSGTGDFYISGQYEAA